MMDVTLATIEKRPEIGVFTDTINRGALRCGEKDNSLYESYSLILFLWIPSVKIPISELCPRVSCCSLATTIVVHGMALLSLSII